MTAVRQTPNRYLERPAPSSLADVIDIILDDTYLRFAEAVNRLDLTETANQLEDVIGG